MKANLISTLKFPIKIQNIKRCKTFSKTNKFTSTTLKSWQIEISKVYPHSIIDQHTLFQSVKCWTSMVNWNIQVKGSTNNMIKYTVENINLLWWKNSSIIKKVRLMICRKPKETTLSQEMGCSTHRLTSSYSISTDLSGMMISHTKIGKSRKEVYWRTSKSWRGPYEIEKISCSQFKTCIVAIKELDKHKLNSNMNKFMEKALLTLIKLILIWIKKVNYKTSTKPEKI